MVRLEPRPEGVDVGVRPGAQRDPRAARISRRISASGHDAETGSPASVAVATWRPVSPAASIVSPPVSPAAVPGASGLPAGRSARRRGRRVAVSAAAVPVVVAVPAVVAPVPTLEPAPMASWLALPVDVPIEDVSV